jgi:hypothetical protein
VEGLDALVERHAAVFVRSGLEIKALLRSIMESDEFYSDRAVRKVYKSPIDFTVSTLRQLGANQPVSVGEDGALKTGTARSILAVTQASKAMGMEVLAPPDVAGWEGGAAWISTATMVERIRWADRLFNAPSRALSGQGGKGKVPTIGFPAATLFDTGDPVVVARKLASIFDVDLPEAKIQSIAGAIRKATGGVDVTAATANEAAHAASRLIFGSPEFQFC